ncbi:MAG: arginine--tRNA ligase [Planctomycetaceae bacterium]|nr:arginine--tRNA ligase [Phycisphaerales bacterium]MCE2652519.1 arginine--tRNA ligase [Planctomycetaceae bacterium]
MSQPPLTPPTATTGSSLPSGSGHDPLSLLKARFAEGIAKAFPGQAGADPSIAASRNAQFGDYQCNAAMALGKAVGQPPRQVAAALVAAVDVGDLAEPLTEKSIAGPGFINITLKADALARLLTAVDTAHAGAEPLPEGQRQTVVVDLCGVNLAKQMHVGHLRSTVIGDTLARVLERLGHRVKRQNHVGDWGLPIAMVTARLMRLAAAGQVDLGRLTLDDLNTAYRAAQKECSGEFEALEIARKWKMGPKIEAEIDATLDGPKAATEAARATLVRLQNHDPAVMAVWQRLVDVTMAACLEICRRLNADVRPEHSAGESTYSGDLAEVTALFEKSGIAQVDDGALVVRLNDVGIAEPLLIRKRDGAALYATTDLAAVRHRVQRLGAQRAVYAVDARQSLHFRQVFAAAHKAGLSRTATGEQAVLEHAAFGTILGEDGTPFKTRSGESYKLSDLLDEATARAGAAVAAKSPDLAASERDAVARAVALAAIRYTDLCTERTKDYVFSLDRMLAFEGNTGPYLLYAVVRVASIFRKATERFGAGAVAAAETAPFVLGQPAEKTLALQLLRYGTVVHEVARASEPSRLCAYLYETAGAFSSFFDQCPVLAAPDEATRAARLRLCRLTQRVLSDGLTLLGIPVVERM